MVMYKNDTNNYYLIDGGVLPEVYVKVVEAKKLLRLGKVKTINDAVIAVGISRSAYYKYKDYVFPFVEKTQGKIITLISVLKDEPGVLSGLLNLFAKSGCNILTINQNIPINGLANISVSIQTGNMIMSVTDLLSRIRAMSGIINVDVIASE